MKRFVTLFLAALLFLHLSGCGEITPPDQSAPEEEPITDLTLWTYPVGAWGNASTTANLLSEFRRTHPNINLIVECLQYDTGDARVEEAIANGTAPDLILEGPERLSAIWGARGLMADLSDLMEQPEAAGIYGNIKEACQYINGETYVFPLCMSAHCMAINYDLFQEAGALQYLNEETRTWTTEGFIQAVQALAAYGQTEIAAVYCGGQVGDQGTRALVTNLYGGTFTDPAHTHYTFNNKENIQALELLNSLPGIRFAPDLVGSTETDKFYKGDLAMTFCWNAALEVQQIINYPDAEIEVLPMAFPSVSGEPRLQGGIWGFGVFDNGDPKRLAAAKEFIRYITFDPIQYRRAVLASTFWPVQDVENIYINDELMSEYSIFTPFFSDYYQITPGWSEARTAWWNMLQHIHDGMPVPEAVQEFETTANAAAGT